MDPADYTLTSYGDPSASTTFGQTAAGNPGTGLEGTFGVDRDNTNGVLFTALNNSFVYDPSVSGAIVTLSASLDRYFAPYQGQTLLGVGAYSLRILAEQNGNLYQTLYGFPPFNEPGGVWVPMVQSVILASDFKLFDPADFAASGTLTGLDFAGSAITFGFAMRSAAAPTVNGVLRADNFSVAINNAVPEPATWTMMVLGIAMVGHVMRRRQTVRVGYAAH